jgi:hypothetical protein
MRLRLVKEPFDDPDYIFELKHDGFRWTAYVESGTCCLVSRNLKNLHFDSLRASSLPNVASCFILLYLMIFELGEAQDYGSTASDFNATFDSMWRRKTSLEYSFGLSFIATAVNK